MTVRCLFPWPLGMGCVVDGSTSHRGECESEVVALRLCIVYIDCLKLQRSFEGRYDISAMMGSANQEVNDPCPLAPAEFRWFPRKERAPKDQLCVWTARHVERPDQGADMKRNSNTQLTQKRYWAARSRSH